MKENKILFFFSLIIIIGFLLPVIYLIVGNYVFTFTGASKSGQIFDYSNLETAIANTLIFSIGGAFLGTILGFIFTWIIVRTNVPAKNILRILLLLSLSMPFLVKAFAWIFLLSPQIGIINVIFYKIFGNILFNIYSLPGMIFVFGIGGLPLAYFTLEPVLNSIDSSLEEYARTCGSRLLSVIRYITIPIVLPAIMSVFILLLIIGIDNFDYPLILGLPAGINTLSTLIYDWLYEYIPPNFGAAAFTSIFYIIITFSLFFFYYLSTRRIFKYVTITGKMKEKTYHNLGKWRYAALAVCVIILIPSFVLPFITIIAMSFLNSFNLLSGFRFTIINYVKFFNLPLLYQGLINSLSFSIIAGLATTFIAFLLSYSALRSKVKGSRVIEILSNIPLAFPGIVYGLALFWTFLLLPGLSYYIYGTIIPLVISLIFIRLPYSIRIVSNNLVQISPDLEEASKVCGGSFSRTIFRILAPLLNRGFINSFLYTLIDSLRELGGIILLVTPQSEVLIILLLQLYDQTALALNIVAAGSVVLTMIVAAFLLISLIIDRRHE